MEGGKSFREGVVGLDIVGHAEDIEPGIRVEIGVARTKTDRGSRAFAQSDIVADDEVRDQMLFHLNHPAIRSEEHTSELQSLLRISYAVFCLNKKTTRPNTLN